MQQEEPYVLTLDKIKEIVSFDKNSHIYKTFMNLIDLWYAIAKRDGKNESEALDETLDKLGKKMLSLNS